MVKSNLIYITGMPGSGKSAVCNELKRRGYTAYDTDNDAIAFFYNNATQKAIKQHIPARDRTPGWRAQHTWKAKRKTIERIEASTKAELPFLCGVTANDVAELWDLFSKVFALIVSDEQALRKRIADRDEDGYGKNAHELTALLQWQRTAAADYKELGAILVDASQPLEKVVDTILAQTTKK
jgi:thymidylate kinase